MDAKCHLSSQWKLHFTVILFRLTKVGITTNALKSVSFTNANVYLLYFHFGWRRIQVWILVVQKSILIHCCLFQADPKFYKGELFFSTTSDGTRLRSPCDSGGKSVSQVPTIDSAAEASWFPCVWSSLTNSPTSQPVDSGARVQLWSWE